MLCDNCGKREANVRYSENINGVKKQLNLCEECSKKLGIGEINFSIPMDINNFFSDFFEELQQPEFKSLIGNVSEEICPTCGKNFEEILNTGRFGCGNCYNTFEDKIDSLIKKLHGTNMHIGRIGSIQENKSILNKESEEIKEENNSSKIEILQQKLKECIKKENYEEAAKIRDEIKELQKNDD